MPLMKNGELLKKIEKLVEDDEITERAAIILNLEASGRLVGDVGEINANVEKIQICVGELTKAMQENPSILWLLKYKTKATASVLFTIFLAIVTTSYFVVTSEPFRAFMINQINLPIN